MIKFLIIILNLIPSILNSESKCAFDINDYTKSTKINTEKAKLLYDEIDDNDRAVDAHA